MKWNTNKPTKPGWYWWRGDPSDDKPMCVEVVLSDGDLYGAWANGVASISDDDEPGEWVGPLEPPA